MGKRFTNDTEHRAMPEFGYCKRSFNAFLSEKRDEESWKTMLKRIRPDQAQKGMYIHAFEGGWFSHPFWRSGFLISNDADLARIRDSSIPGVVIDITKGAALDPPAPQGTNAVAPPRPSSAKPLWTLPVALPVADDRQTRDRRDEDRRQAMRTITRSKRAVRRLFENARLGQTIRSADIVSVVDEISALLDRNRLMLIGITRLKSKHEYTYLHSVAVCALMVNLAREIGMDEHTVRLMGLAGLLHDVGKMSIDTAILDKPGPLTEAEYGEMRHHAARGHAMLAAGEDVPETALDVCLHHHEKLDGTGYPFGLAGDAISMAARMASICDVYDAVTSARAYKEPWSAGAAITAMDGWTGHFDTALLFRFMNSIGLYPAGMLARLRSNRLGIVLDGGPRATRTRVRIFYTIADRDFIAPHDITLSDTLAGDRIVRREDPATWDFADWDDLRARILAA